MPILATKLYIPPLRPRHILRSRLSERLTESSHHKVILVSAPAGFGKTSLISEWLSDRQRPAAWLSLDDNDNDPTRFLSYLIAALHTIAPDIGQGIVRALQAPQPPPLETTLTALLNEITAIAEPFTLILDDYHLITVPPIDQALTFLIGHLPPLMQLVIVTREDPPLPLHQLRARDQLTELRAADLRFTLAEAAGFLNQTMGLTLSPEDIAALEARTEGWIVGLQFAAISLQGVTDTARFIQSFAGSHHFILDYLLEEVLHKQSPGVQNFLLQTSILDRLCGSQCEAVLSAPAGVGQKTLEYLEQANLFIIPLDNERRWYRYHPLFADLLRQRLSQSTANVEALHLRASLWYEHNGFQLEAFQHAVATHDIDRAAYLVEGNGMPIIFRGVFHPVLNWLGSLPTTTLDSRPALWVLYASALLIMGQLPEVEAKLQAAEAVLQSGEQDDQAKDLIGHIAAIRANAAVPVNQVDTILIQARRALDYLHPNNLPVRTSATFALGYAYQLQGNRRAARQAYSETLAISQKVGQNVTALMALGGLGNIQEADNQLHLAMETYQRYLKILGEPTLPVGCEGHLGLARIFYEWNDLEAAEHHAREGARLARQIEHSDRYLIDDLWLARVKLAQGDPATAATLLAQAMLSITPHSLWLNSPEAIAAKILIYLGLDQYDEALQLAQTHARPVYTAQVDLAQGEARAALTVLELAQQQAQANGWADELLNVMVLQAIALHQQGERAESLRRLGEALALAEPDGFIRIFVDKGQPMAQLLTEAAAYGMRPNYVGQLLAAFEADAAKRMGQIAQPLIEPLSQRELEILRLISQGLSNDEIRKRLFLALDTVKGHNRKIFEKLHVQRRTEAVAQARKLGLL